MTVLDDGGAAAAAWPARALAELLAAFALGVAALHLVPDDTVARLPSLGVPAEVLGSTAEFRRDGKTQPRRPGEERIVFVGASETFALPYEPPGLSGYAFYLGAGYARATGRSDVRIRGEGTPALDSVQVAAQAKRVLEEGDASCIVLVVGANEYLGRIVRGKPMLPDAPLERLAQFGGVARRLFDLGESMLSDSGLRGLLASAGATPGVGSFLELTRQAAPGRPALRGLPIGRRDRVLLLDRLRRQVRDVFAACQRRGARFAVALSLHGLDGSPPWCSELEPGPPELTALLTRVLQEPDPARLAVVERWIARFPERADLRHARAKLLRTAGRASEARGEFLAALDLDLAPVHQTGEVRDALRDEAAALGVPFLDLSEALLEADGIPGPRMFLDYAHADIAGHRRIAMFLALTQQGKLLPPLPAGWEERFVAGMDEWGKFLVPSSAERAQARMSLNVGRYYMVFGNFRDALPHLELAARDLGSIGEKQPAKDLEFCRAKLQAAGALR
jgi:tetratricopeptide (TPR) repeat protein